MVQVVPQVRQVQGLQEQRELLGLQDLVAPQVLQALLVQRDPVAHLDHRDQAGLLAHQDRVGLPEPERPVLRVLRVRVDLPVRLGLEQQVRQDLQDQADPRALLARQVPV